MPDALNVGITLNKDLQLYCKARCRPGLKSNTVLHEEQREICKYDLGELVVYYSSVAASNHLKKDTKMRSVFIA